MSMLSLCIALMLSVVHGDPYVCDESYKPANFINFPRVPTNCSAKSPSDCPRSWKSGIPEGLATSKPLIYQEFIICHEGFSTCGYVPINPKNGKVSGNSGVTIGAGVDLGSKSAKYPGFSSLPSPLVGKLEPYFGLKTNLAACAAIELPLTLSTNEAKDLTNAVKDHVAKKVEERYNKDKEGKSLEFSSLPRGIRTAIVSVWFQFGYPKAYPIFWEFVTKNDWEKAIEELRHFYKNPNSQLLGDLKRRFDEANIIEATLLECNRSIDAVFLLDESGSVSSRNFAESLDFVKNLIRAFPDDKLRGEDDTRFGLSTFNGHYTSHFYLSNYKSQSEYQAAISNVLKQSGNTHLGVALNRILDDQFSEQRGRRSENDGVPGVLIVLTDGKSSDNVATPAQRVRDQNIVIYAIGIGNYNLQQLHDVASSPSHVYTLSQFSELETFIATLTAATCNEPQPVSLSNTVEAATVKDEYQYFRYTIDQDTNLELDVVDIAGETFVFASRDNPHPYKYDNDISFETSSQKNKILVISPKVNRSVRKRSTRDQDMATIYVSVTANSETASFTIKGNTCDPLNCTEGTNEVKSKSGLSLIHHGCSPVAFILALFYVMHLYL